MKAFRGVLGNLYKCVRDPRNTRWYISALRREANREYIANLVVDAARSVMGLMNEDDGEHQLRFGVLRERLAAFDAAHANDQLPPVSGPVTAEKRSQ